MITERIYLSPPDTTADDRELLLDAFDSNWIAPLGPHVDAFERELAEKVGVTHAGALSSGTAALHLALLLVGVGPGDEVIVPTLTFVATANAARYVGAEPIFVDSDLTSWNVDANLVASELYDRARRGRRPAAVISVDLLGGCPDYDVLESACEELEIPLVEDAAEALGASFRGRPAGSFGVCATFSFNGNKIITTSGGGMLVSNSVELIDHARSLATQAREPVAHYEHVELGYNYRLSNLLAALGRGQLRGLDRRIASRKAINERYAQAFNTVEGIELMPFGEGVTPNYWLTCVRIDPERFGAGPESIRLDLERINVEARPIWKPLHLQPLYKGAQTVGGSVAEELFAEGLCLPSGSRLEAADQDRIIETILNTPARSKR
jgi:dTDP-4-amino-4,6-dideoxygalactose transaminase